MSWNIQSPFSEKRTGEANPFFLYANESMPQDQQSSLDFCVHLTNLNSTYAAATKRIVSHFITQIEFSGEGGDYKEREQRVKLLVDNLNVFQSMQTIGEDGFCYGVAVVRMHLPFDRYLIKRGKTTDGNVVSKRVSINSIPEAHLTYDHKNLKFKGPDIDLIGDYADKLEACPKIDYDFDDVFVKKEDDIRLIHLDPRHFKLRKAPQSGKVDVIYKFDPEELQYIRNGNIFYVNNTHKSMLQAIAKDMAFIFDPGAVFVYAPPSITGISKHGLGIPTPIAHYRDLFQWQLYRKADETIAKDFLVPLRLFTPDVNGSSGGMDAGATMNIALWKKNMSDIIKRYREKRDSMFAAPMPTTYQELNTNGKQFTQKELLEWQTDSLLNGLGYPAELYRGSLAYQQIPPALRLFERTFHHIPHFFNKFLKWVNKRVSAFLRITEFDVRLAPPRIADSVERMNYVMNLVSGGEAPREALFELLQLGSPVEAYRRRLKEDSQFEKSRAVEEIQFSKEQETSLSEIQAQGGGGGADGPVTPLSRQEEAMAKAKEWAAMPEASRKQDMENTKNTNVELHALAQQFLKQIRTEAESQGRNQAVNPQ